MYRRRGRGGGRRSRAKGCLLVVLLLFVVLLVLSLMFGGFTKGTKSGSLGLVSQMTTSAQFSGGGGRG